MPMRTLGRKRDARRSLIRSLVTNAVLNERLVTTTARGKEAKAWIDRVIEIGKEKDLSARRRLFAFLFDPAATRKVIEDLAPRYKKRTGGYTQWIPLGRRKGDGAQMVMLKLLPGEAPKTKELKTKKPKTRKSAKPKKGSKKAKK